MASDALQPGLPRTLARLQGAREGAEREAAWVEFLAAHSDVVLHTCRSVAREHDVALDAYAFALDALREHDHRRLRAYRPDGKTRFAVWLVVVTRRLVLDYLRHRYGRTRSSDEERRAEGLARRRLEDLVAAEVEPDQLPDPGLRAPDADLRARELTDAVRLALAQLSEQDRLLLTLRFVDERSIRDISRSLRLPSVFHVYRRLKVVLATLREQLRRRGVEDPEP